MLRACCSFLLMLLCCLMAVAEPMRYVYPPPESDNDHRYDYYWDLLRAALESNKEKYGPYVLVPHAARMNATRATVSMRQPDGLTLLLRVTNSELEETFRPVRIPLDKGLTGYRLFLIKAETQPRLDGVRSFEDLKPFSFGVGAKWIDVTILRAAGLTVEPGEDYAGLFRMLEARRFDIFSRGVNEIAVELKENIEKNPDLVIENKLMLYFPLARYFFTNRTPEGEKLAQRIEDGLQRLVRSGEFERRYQVFKQQCLVGLNLAGRRLLRITNPTLPPETPLAQKQLWETLSKELKATP